MAFAPSLAQARAGDPKFEHRSLGPVKAEDKPQWKVNLTLGALYVEGNAMSLGISGTAFGGVKFKENAVELFAQAAYGLAGVNDARRPNGPYARIDEAVRQWLWQVRYDRYFLESNTIYALFRMSGNPFAGIEYRIEPQVGYARILYQSTEQVLRAELGYAYTYEKYPMGVTPNNDDAHSLRVFTYYERKLTERSAISEALEVLQAFDRLAFTRVNSTTSLSAALSRNLALKLNFTFRFNGDPPSRPAPNVGKFDKIDNLLEIVLAVTFPGA